MLRFHDMCQDAEETWVSTEASDMIRLNVFTINSMKSIIIAKLKTKTSQRTELYKYKININSDGNLLPIRMFKALYPNRKTMDQNKSIGKKLMGTMAPVHQEH